MLHSSSTANDSEFELCFQSVRGSGCVYAFPCDAAGRVDLDGLSERQRDCYFYARAVTGIELLPPLKQRAVRADRAHPPNPCPSPL